MTALYYAANVDDMFLQDIGQLATLLRVVTSKKTKTFPLKLVNNTFWDIYIACDGIDMPRRWYENKLQMKANPL